MNFALSEDHETLRASAQAFVDKETDLTALLVPGASVADAGYAANWAQIKALGWPGIVVPEADGGLGLDDIDLAVVMMEIGRTLLPSPFAGHTFASWALLAAASREQRGRLLPEVATGDLRLALVPPMDGNGVTCSAERLTGSHDLVLDADGADWLIVAARAAAADPADAGFAFYLVDATAAGVSIDVQPWRDITRQVCRVSFADVPAEVLTGAGPACWRGVHDRISCFLAAENVGGMRRVLADTVDYAKQRVAFGRTIGSYQAIKHPLAEMLAQLESANVAVLYAAWALAGGDPRASLAAAMAKSFSADAYCAATHRSIQIFGAIGFTWEMPNHLFFKRARGNAALFGDSRAQREHAMNLATGRQWSAPFADAAQVRSARAA